MSFLTRQNAIKLVSESSLIIFSVLLALLLNEYREHLKEEKLKTIALQKVTSELEKNLQTVESWYEYHIVVYQNFSRAIDDDSLKKAMARQKEFNFWSLMPNGVVRRVVSRSAWQALQTSDVFSSIDFETMLALSVTYNSQALGVETSLRIIQDILTSRESLRKEEIERTLILLRNAFMEIAAQEEFLIREYKTTLEKLKVFTTDNHTSSLHATSKDSVANREQ